MFAPDRRSVRKAFRRHPGRPVEAGEQGKASRDSDLPRKYQEEVLAAQVIKMNSAKTVNGQSLTISTNGGTVVVANAKVVKTDILCSNGVIHVIDSVVLPK